MKRWLVTAAAVLAFSAAANAQQRLTISTGGTGGVWYPMGGAMANVLSKYLPNTSATAEVTGGSVDNLRLIGTGKPYIALAMADASQDAYRGEDKFKGNKVPLRTLMVLYTNIMHVVTVEGTGISVTMHPQQTFREGFNKAGDDILLRVIQNHVLPAIETAMADAGLANPEDLTTELFRSNRGGEDVETQNLRRQFALQVASPIGLALLLACEGYQPLEATVAPEARPFDSFFPPGARPAPEAAPAGARPRGSSGKPGGSGGGS